MPLSADDLQPLRRAAALAEGSVGLSEPNPRVGCVMHGADGQLAGLGFTQQAGGPHAEVMALRDAQARGASLQGGTAWVTLEPCAHHGRTPPCADALVAVGLKRVVVASTDPFAQVAGRGIARLRAAGIQVDLLDDAALRREIQDLNIGFFSRIARGRPWVRAKVAVSLDGRTALPDGRSQWITGPEARADGHAWRKRAGAVLTGSGTVRDDDARLDVREVPTQVQPMRVLLDSGFAQPLARRLLAPPGRRLVVGARAPDAARTAAYAEAGIDWLALPGTDGRVDLAALMAALAERQVNELHVEAGAVLTGALWQACWIDEWLIYQAPKLIGPGRPLAALAELPELAAVRPLERLEATPVGEDLRLRLRVAGADAFLPGAA